MRGYRINYPEEPIAWKALDFEYRELSNWTTLLDLAAFVGETLPADSDEAYHPELWAKMLSKFRNKYGDAKGTWLTRTKEEVLEYDERFGGYCLIYEYDPKLIVSDLGPDGFFVLNARFIKEEEL